MELGDQDIFANVAGGLKVDEPAADLGIISAMMSSFLTGRWTGAWSCLVKLGWPGRSAGSVSRI